jgi:hypothetical protein
MFSTYDGAKRFSKKLHKAVAADGAPLSLRDSQTAIARAAGFRDWQHMRDCGPDFCVNPGCFERRLSDELSRLTKLPDARVAGILRELQIERREIGRIWRSEALSSLPDTIEELVDALRDPEREDSFDILEWAKAFGATSECSICDATIVDAYSFAEAAIEHYAVSDEESADAQEGIERALRLSAVETGGWGDGSLCAYHNEVMAKDD